MITIEEQTLKELILKTEPSFLAQQELELNGYGRSAIFQKHDTDPVWIWNRGVVRSSTSEQLDYLVLKIIS